MSDPVVLSVDGLPGLALDGAASREAHLVNVDPAQQVAIVSFLTLLLKHR